jgi:hypothetical protein
MLSTTLSVIEYCEYHKELSYLCDAKGISNDNNADNNEHVHYNLAHTYMRDNLLIKLQAIYNLKMQANNALPQANCRAFCTMPCEVFSQVCKESFS